MKTFVIFMMLFFSSSANVAHAYTNDLLAKCSALNNNFNQKYGVKLLDSGETYNTVMNDKLYYASSAYQLLLMAKISHLEGWDISSYQNFLDEMENSKFYSRVWVYDTKTMQKLSTGKLQLRMSEMMCFNKFQEFGHSPGEEDIILKNFDTITPYIEKLRGF
ncbi:hypothetical protein OAT45_04780 [Alphaproteobacteria bacterium]|nr:hypothetical protein [Alphaproteobacteria bacterium]